MRSQPAGRIAPRHAAIGALALGTTLSATALAFAQTAPVPASSAVPRPPVVQDANLRLGQRADVHGRFAASDAGRRIALQYAPRGARWRQVATTTVEAGGRYRFRVGLERSGALRIVLLPALAPVTRGGAAPAPGVVTAEAARASDGRRVAVAGRLVVGHRGHDVQVGERRSPCAARCCRARAGAASSLRRARTAAGTSSRGRARARTATSRRAWSTHAPGTQRLRVRFAGDRRNAGARAGAGTLQAFRSGLASWYALYGGALACGGTLGYDTLGVANKYAAVRHEGDAALPRPRGHGAGDRPRPVRRRARMGSDGRDGAPARVRRRRGGVEHEVAREHMFV